MKSYEELAANIAAVEKIGNWIALSKMFGDMTVNQGCIIAADCFITGVPLLEYQRRNQLVSGRPNIPYDAMLAAFQERGGQIKILQRDADGCRIEMIYKGQTTPFSLMWSDASKEAFVYGEKGVSEADIVKRIAAGNPPQMKPKYATPRSRATMLFARCVSDAIRAVAPEVNFGRYTPEELEDIDDTLPAVKPAGTMAAPTIAKPTVTEAQATVQTTAPPAVQNKLPLEPVDVPAATFLESPADQPATEQQREEAIRLLGAYAQEGLNWTERLKAKLQAHKIAGGILGLTHGEAQSLIDKLKVRDFDSWFVSAIFGHAAKAEGSHRPS